MKYDLGTVVFGNWSIKRKIGEGSFGQVFEIQREEFGQVYHAALKVITVPQNEAELQILLEEGMTEAEVEQYFYSIVEKIVHEITVMTKLKGTSNVVGYEDHVVLRHAEDIGWDILIRMELLNPLLPYAYQHPFSRRDIIQLGIDMCKALELCQKYNIIHRDIKPENIFMSDNGDFKLGDFGIACTVEKTLSGLSKRGTYNYMAPEVYRGDNYGFTVDTYSLGIVLYRLLNKNRLPFLPPSPEPITYHSRESALIRRMSGESVPMPFHAEGRLAEIVLKACAFSPKDRYSSPAQMRQELEAILYALEDTALIYPDGDKVALTENKYASETPKVKEEKREASVDVTEKTEFVFSTGKEKKDLSENSASENGSAEQEQADPYEQSKTESVFSAKRKELPTTEIKTTVDAPKEDEKSCKEASEKKKTHKWSTIRLISVVSIVLVCVIGFSILIKVGINNGKEDNSPAIDPGSNNNAELETWQLYRAVYGTWYLFWQDPDGDLYDQDIYLTLDEYGTATFEYIYRSDGYTTTESYEYILVKNIGDLKEDNFDEFYCCYLPEDDSLVVYFDGYTLEMERVTNYNTGGTAKPVTPQVDLSKIAITVPLYGTSLPKIAEGKFTANLTKGESFGLVVQGTDVKPAWSVADSSIATVSSDGTIKGVNSGETIVTANLNDTIVEIIVCVKDNATKSTCVEHFWIASNFDENGAVTEYTCDRCKTVGTVVYSVFAAPDDSYIEHLLESIYVYYYR